MLYSHLSYFNSSPVVQHVLDQSISAVNHHGAIEAEGIIQRVARLWWGRAEPVLLLSPSIAGCCACSCRNVPRTAPIAPQRVPPALSTLLKTEPKRRQRTRLQEGGSRQSLEPPDVFTPALHASPVTHGLKVAWHQGLRLSEGAASLAAVWATVPSELGVAF